MAVKLTPALLQAAYALLLNTTPFRGWHLPPPENIKFQVLQRRTTNTQIQADYQFDGTHRIRVVGTNHHTIGAMIRTVAHEMVHMKQHLDGHEVNHGALFARMADRVCAVHSFDRGQF